MGVFGFGFGFQNPVRLSGGGVVYDTDYQAILDEATSQGMTLPSDAVKLLQNQLMIDIKAAANNGLASYKYGKVYNNNIDYGGSVPSDLGFDGLNWVNPALFQSSRVNTVTKTPKKGYAGDGATSYLTSGLEHQDLGVDDTGFCSVYFDVVEAGLAGDGFHQGANTQTMLSLPKFGGDAYIGVNGLDTKAIADGDRILFGGRITDGSGNGNLYLQIDNGALQTTAVAGLNTTLYARQVYELAVNDNDVLTKWYLNASISLGVKLFYVESEVNKASLYTALTTYISGINAL